MEPTRPTAAVIGPCLLGAVAAVALLWPGGAGPLGLLPPDRLAGAIAPGWLLWCLWRAGDGGAGAALAGALPVLVAVALLAPDGWVALPGVLCAAAVGAWWWSAGAGDPDDPHAPTRLLAALGLLVAPALLGALWSSVGVGWGGLPGWVSPFTGDAPRTLALLPLAVLTAFVWWRRREASA